MKVLLVLLLALIDPEMSSKKASFDGKAIVLEEDVVLEHPFGKLKTQKAYLEKGDSDKISFEKARLEDGVEVQLASGQVLKGQTAEADLSQKRLKFLGDVSVNEPGGMKLQAQDAEAFFEEKENRFIVTSLSAKGDVVAEFQQGRKVFCSSALYKPRSFFELSGSNDKKCRLIDQDLDIQSDSGSIDLDAMRGSLKGIDAVIKFMVGDLKSTFKLKSEQINFCDKTKVIESSKKAFIESDAYGLWGDLSSFKIKLKESNQLNEAALCGHVKIKAELGQSLEFNGSLKLHEGRQQMLLLAKEGENILFKSSEFIIKSKKARLFYRQSEERFIPIKLELDQDISFYDLRTGRSIYGKASSASVFMEEERIHLFGKDQEPVLYVNETIDLNLSAPEVVLKKAEQGKFSAQGLGAVRFSFNDEEKKLVSMLKRIVHE